MLIHMNGYKIKKCLNVKVATIIVKKLIKYEILNDLIFLNDRSRKGKNTICTIVPNAIRTLKKESMSINIFPISNIPLGKEYKWTD